MRENGGRYPKWGPPGSGELYYVDLDGDVMAATVELEPTLRLGGVGQKVLNARAAAGRGWRYAHFVVLNSFNELRLQAP